MSLEKYRQKRQFDRTPEPRGRKSAPAGPLRFVVQKHLASRLHYDLRLELEGTLKSWAVPKGPSLNPHEKRLAIMVEDHPLDYQHFEGVIPEGNYGAGTVMVWDHGHYCARSSADRDESERLVRQGIERGDLKIILDGQKLKGEFAIVKIRKDEANTWLLIKKRDAFATCDDVTSQDCSVISGRSMDEITRAGDPPAAAGPQSGGPDPRGRQSEGRHQAGGYRAGGKPPRRVQPMLATPIEQAFDRAGWYFEVKWDGFRAIAEIEQGRVGLYSRNQRSLETRFPPIVRALETLGHDAVLDGEIVVLDDAGRSSFERLQNYAQTGGALAYFVFDLLYLDGHDLRGLPLARRKELLKSIISTTGVVRFCEHVETQGRAFYRAVGEHGLEGMVAKDSTSRYVAGKRSQSWLKIKAVARQEVVIGGFTEPRGSRRGLGALLLGVYAGQHLVFVGQAGSGFTERSADQIRSQLEKLTQAECPFQTRPKPDAPVHWVKPELVCEVKFQNWTSQGILRQPVFLGMRDDKPAREVHRETPAPSGPRPLAGQAAMPVRTGRARERRLIIVDRELKLTNLDKVLWPADGFTKGDLIEYYRLVAPAILPYLEDRPLSLHRFPDGITAEGFYQKDLKGPPSWLQTIRIPSGPHQRPLNTAICQDEASLVYLANLACIELNPWASRVDTLDRPDYLVLDLDTDDAPFDLLVRAALAVRRTLDRAEVPCVAKTSGQKGIHVYVPLAARYSYDQALQFAELLARLVHAELPGITSLERSPEKRRGLVYIDYLQNRRAQTIAAVYSVRPYPGGTVSTPLRWPELKRGLDPAKFNMKTVPRRLQELGDVWKPVLGSGADILQALDRLQQVHARRHGRGKKRKHGT